MDPYGLVNLSTSALEISRFANPLIDWKETSLIPSFFGSRRANVMDPYGLVNLSTSARKISQFANPLIDWKETPEGYVFKADLPGLKKEEVKVEVKRGRILQISGERKKEQEEKNDKWHQIERGSGKFKRRFQLPENAKVEEVKASMKNGVLTVTLPKVEEKKHKVKVKVKVEVEVEVEVKNGRILQISGEKKKVQEEKNDKWHQIEQSSRKFQRRFQLPETAKVEKVKTNTKNGVLAVTLPKVEEKKYKVKSIDISG